MKSERYDHTHEHDDDVTSVSLQADRPLDPAKFNAWFGELLREKGLEILRSKGILDILGESERYVIQGIHMLMEGDFLGSWPDNQPRQYRHDEHYRTKIPAKQAGSTGTVD